MEKMKDAKQRIMTLVGALGIMAAAALVVVLWIVILCIADAEGIAL